MNQVWCIPSDCVSFLAAATSWDQLYINLGNNFLSDTTDKILTQIRDLIELDEIDKWRPIVFNLVERTLAYTPSINQDLLVANVSEKIFYDYRSIKKNINETYKEGIDEVYIQYKNIISSRAASGDMPDQCVQELVCSLEQFKNRLLARGEKVSMHGNMFDQIIQLNKTRFEEKGINSKKLDVVKEQSNQMMKDLLENRKFKRFDSEQKAGFVQANLQKLILDKYNNDPKVQTILDKTRSISLPIIRNYIDQDAQSYEMRSQISKEINRTNSIHKHVPQSFIETDRRRRVHKHRSRDYQYKQMSAPFTDCPDYDPYRNYAEYKEKRLLKTSLY